MHSARWMTSLAVLVMLAAACGGVAVSPVPQPSGSSVPTASPTLSGPPSTASPASPTLAPTASNAPPTSAPVIPALEPAPSVNSYYCVTQLDTGLDKDYLWITTVRDHNAQEMRYDRQRADGYTSYFMIQIGDRQWEDFSQGYKATDLDTERERQARAFEVPALFTRFFLDTNSLAGFVTSDELENASNIQSHVYRAGPDAKAAMTADEAIGSVSSAAYAVSADAGVLVEARFNGQTKTGEDLHLTLACNQYDDPSQVVTAP